MTFTGKVLQMAGLVLLPIALWIGLVEGRVRTEVALLAVGSVLFLAGWLLTRERQP